MRLALRSLARAPGFTAIAVLTIGLGLGANTALFSVFDRLVLNPVSLPQPSSLVAIWAVNNSIGFVAPALSWPRYVELSREAKSFSSIANSAADNFNLTGEGDPAQLAGLRVTASFFPTLGVVPALGRNFSPEEDVPNGPAVAILSHELWQTRFGGRTGIVGENIRLNGQPWQVVGVLPPRLSNPFGQAQIFAPRVSEIRGLNPQQIQVGAGYSQPIARLKPGVSLEQARAELAALGRTYRERFATHLDADNITEPRRYTETLVGPLRPAFYTLIGGVAFVLLIACANVASLFLGRLFARHREIAVRQSLGATRGAIVRQFLAESLLFSSAAGVLGVLFSLWALSAVQAAFAAQLPANTVLTIDWRALAFSGAVTLLCAVLVGVVPAWQASKSNLVEVLKDAARGSSGGVRGHRLRSALIVAEVALSVVLLVGSGLLLLTFSNLQRTPPGFNPRGVASAFVGVPLARYATGAEQAAFFDSVLERLRAAPQVQSAAVAIGLPLSGFNPRAPYSVAGRPILPLAQRPLAGFAVVSDDYFRAMEIPLREGRPFGPQDREGAPGACIINESLAQRLFPGESALGKVLTRGRDADIRHEIVGVIANVKTNGLNAPVPDEVYYPHRQLGRPGMAVIAKLAPPAPGAPEGDAAALQAIMRTAVTGVDKDQPISFFATLDANLARSLGNQRIVASLTGIFAGLALLLAALGLYSVLAHTVAQRTGEIGIRMALGAQRGQVVALVLRGGLKLVVLGLVVGLAAAAGAARLIQRLLFQVQPLDPLVYGGVAVLFLLVALLACLLPSLRASRIDPIVALRAD